MSQKTYDLTLERIALMRRMVVAWSGTEPGAPIIHPDAPYGSTDRDGDIANVTGDDEGADDEHRALQDGLAVFAQNARLKPGTYQYHNPLAKLDRETVSDVFRDAATGETPEQIVFAVTQEHLTLIPHLSQEWDDASDVPRVDPKRPYGGACPYAAGMAGYLGEAPETDPAGHPIITDAQEDRMVRLHREMQPALQIFLRYADLGPGRYRQASPSLWQPA